MSEQHDLLRAGSTAVTLVVADELELRIARRRGGEGHVLRTRRDSMDRLVAALRNGVAPEPVADPEARLVDVLTDWLTGEEDADPDLLVHTARWLHDRAGVDYEQTRLDESGTETAVKRTEVLRRTDGCTYVVEIEPDSTWPIRFAETYRAAGQTSDYSHDVTVRRPVPAALADQHEVIAAIRARVDRDDLPPGEARDRVAAWLDEIGVAHSRTGRNRDVQLPAAGLELVLTIESGDGQVRFAASRKSEPGTFHLETERASMPTLVEFFEQRTRPSAGVLDDRLVAALTTLARSGQLAGTPMTVRDRLAGWYGEAGVPYTCRAFGRGRHIELVSVHRERTDCVFSLKVHLDPDDERKGIGLSETYDYLPSKSDPGREYAYSAYAPYSALERLVTHLEAGAPGDGELEQRLIDRLAARVDSGDLGAHLPIEANHDRAAEWFEQAGVPVEKENWSWFNS